MIERCSDKHWKNKLHDFREKISILLWKTANDRFRLWRWKTTFRHSKDNQDFELILLLKRRWRSRIYWNLFFIEFSLLISHLLLNSFMRFWKKMFHLFEKLFNKKSWTFWRSLSLILRFLFSLIMKSISSYLRWTQVLKIEKRFWWFCAMKRNIQCVMKAIFDQTRKKNTTSQKKMSWCSQDFEKNSFLFLWREVYFEDKCSRVRSSIESIWYKFFWCTYYSLTRLNSIYRFWNSSRSQYQAYCCKRFVQKIFVV
jgi:hypothetical protein